MDNPLYKLVDVVKRYEGHPVLQTPLLELAAGGVTALEGPNGSGKTTLLRILALLIAPEQGQVFFQGRLMNSAATLTPFRRQITLVAQDAYLFQSTVEGNLAYGLKLRGLQRGRRRQRVEQALETVGLAGFGPRRARELSRGEGQRVALARALALEPRVLLLDEPFANLDPESSEVFERVIGGLPERGCSVILVTHGRAQARRLAQRVLALEAGRLVEQPES